MLVSKVLGGLFVSSESFSNLDRSTLVEKDHLGDRSPEKDCC